MIEKREKRQYGLWDSPISSRSLGRELDFKDVQWDQSGSLVWLENRSDRGVLMVQPAQGGAARELNSEYSVRALMLPSALSKLDFGVAPGHRNPKR